jgi:hypothetical protein
MSDVDEEIARQPSNPCCLEAPKYLIFVEFDAAKTPVENVPLNYSRKVSALTALSPHHVKGCGCIKSVTTTGCLPDAATLLSRAPLMRRLGGRISSTQLSESLLESWSP